MDIESISAYQSQLSQVEAAISCTKDEASRSELLSLRDNIIELIGLGSSSKPTQHSTQTLHENDKLEDEYALFMAEMEREGATTNDGCDDVEFKDKLKSLEGKKCRAPHTHQWGDTAYHNALVCSVIPSKSSNDFDEVEVKVLFTNPTHREMLPCPYYLESECKFSEDQCRFSHGEIVIASSLREYIEPDFESLAAGCKVLAKRADKLWYRGKVKRLYAEKCLVRFESNSKDVEVDFQDVLPLDGGQDLEESCSEDDVDGIDQDDTINMSLLNTPSSGALGEWERHTKGLGSKIMQRMGYIIGTGLGKLADGRLEPVTAVALPAGKSLDHCMNLREQSGGDKNLFSVERKLKRLQRRQEQQRQKAYERDKNKVNVFNFLNGTISQCDNQQSVSTIKQDHRRQIAKESSRNLNVAGFKVEEEIKRAERDLFRIRESLNRHSAGTQVHKKLLQKMTGKQAELQALQAKATNISSEQNLRFDKKKMTIF